MLSAAPFILFSGGGIEPIIADRAARTIFYGSPYLRVNGRARNKKGDNQHKQRIEIDKQSETSFQDLSCVQGFVSIWCVDLSISPSIIGIASGTYPTYWNNPWSSLVDPLMQTRKTNNVEHKLNYSLWFVQILPLVANNSNES